VKLLSYRAPSVSHAALVLVALVALTALVAVESLPVHKKQPYYENKLMAARLMREAMSAIKAEKLRRGIAIDPQSDPGRTGLIGSSLTPVTSNTGYLSAKQASTNPNFAAVLVQLLEAAGTQRGDVVAVGLTGSFPALNIAAYAAIQTLGLQPIVITSAAASEWGANQIDLLWIDMERVLNEKGIFRFRSVAASRGGIDDRGFGMSAEGRALLDAAIERNGLTALESKSLPEAIERRMQLYEQRANGRRIKAYINIGGGTASVGTHVGRKQF
jgi:poly-gamma-glutamate system protein